MNKTQTFEENESSYIASKAAEELKVVEQSIRTANDRRMFLKSIIDKVKGQRPDDYVENQVPVRKMFADQTSMAKKINLILTTNTDKALTSAEITDKYVELLGEKGIGKVKKAKMLKNISTILSIGNKTKYDRFKPEDSKKYAYRMLSEQSA